MHTCAFLDKSHQIVYIVLEIKNMLEQVATETLQEKAYRAIRDCQANRYQLMIWQGI
jgi:hypothetical protein